MSSKPRLIVMQQVLNLIASRQRLATTPEEHNRLTGLILAVSCLIPPLDKTCLFRNPGWEERRDGKDTL